MSYGHALNVLRRISALEKDGKPDWLVKDAALYRPDTPEMKRQGWIDEDGTITEKGRKALAAPQNHREPPAQ